MTSIMHKIPTVNMRSQSKHGTAEAMISIDSSGEPHAISPRFANALIPNSNQHATSSDKMIDLGLRDSRLTNIVLDDFRKQVIGLEMQVGSSPLSKSPLACRKAASGLNERQSPNHGSPNRQNQESTDLEEQHNGI